MQLLEVLPVGAHNFFVVVADERFEDLAVVWVASVDLCEEAIHQESVDHDLRLLLPDRGARHV